MRPITVYSNLEVWPVGESSQIFEGPAVIQLVEHVDLHRARQDKFLVMFPLSKGTGKGETRM